MALVPRLGRPTHDARPSERPLLAHLGHQKAKGRTRRALRLSSGHEERRVKALPCARREPALLRVSFVLSLTNPDTARQCGSAPVRLGQPAPLSSSTPEPLFACPVGDGAVFVSDCSNRIRPEPRLRPGFRDHTEGRQTMQMPVRPPRECIYVGCDYSAAASVRSGSRSQRPGSASAGSSLRQ